MPPVLTVPGPQTQDYHDPLSFSVSATDADNDPITLSVSGLPASLNFVDNGNGTGSVSGTLTVIPGVYTATFAASDGHNPPVKKDVKITVTKEETATVYTGPTVILNGGNATLSATLKEDGIGADRRPHGGLHARRAGVQRHDARHRRRELHAGGRTVRSARRSRSPRRLPAMRSTFPRRRARRQSCSRSRPEAAFVVGDTSAGSGAGDVVGQLVGEAEYFLGRHRLVMR